MEAFHPTARMAFAAVLLPVIIGANLGAVL
jgi:hypothetical protein